MKFYIKLFTNSFFYLLNFIPTYKSKVNYSLFSNLLQNVYIKNIKLNLYFILKLLSILAIGLK